MSSLPTPPRLGLRVPLPRAPREGGEADDGLVSGDILEGRYQIEDRLGEGGVGYVYRARFIKLHRRVAIKLLQNDALGDEELKPRFEREALTLAALSHPHIVSLIDYGSVRGKPYLVMELLEGRTLRELIDQEGAIEPVRALGIARQVLLALAYAHELGVVHRDLKPANLLMQSLPCHEHVKVLDFGLVKFTPGSYLDRGVQLSRVGFTFGTPAYMSPEHAVGGEVDGRSDLYAMGVLIFELLTGEKPFEGELQDVLRHHFQTPVPKLWSKRAQLNGRNDLQALVETAMAKEREDRFADAGAMISAIDALIGPRSKRANERTEQIAVLAIPDRLGSLRSGVNRASQVALEKGRALFIALKSRGGPLLLRLGQSLKRGAYRSLLRTRRASVDGYTWLKPRAVAAARRLSERARSMRAGSEPRQQKAEGEELLGERLVHAETPAELTESPSSASAPEQAPPATDRAGASADLPASTEDAGDDAAATVIDPVASASPPGDAAAAEPGDEATTDAKPGAK
jgi:serine/threonine protein kinase